MLLQKKYKALTALAVSSGGALAVLPLLGSGFFWDLLEAAFLASTIGGLADWFAVTAIFKKPLGIAYRTDILRKNRTRIMHALVDYTANDLLSAANIMSVVQKIDMANMLSGYLVDRAGRNKLKDIAFSILSLAAKTMDTAHIAERIYPAICENLKGFPLEKMLLRFFDMLAEEKNSAYILRALLNVAHRILHDVYVQDILLENIRKVRENYEQQAPLRAMAIQMLGLSDERLRDIVVKHIDDYISDLLKGEAEAYGRLLTAFRERCRLLGENPSLKEALAVCKERYFEQIDLLEQLASWLERNIKGEKPFWREPLFVLLDAKIDEFIEKESLQRRGDAMCKKFLEAELYKHHAVITQMIQEHLEAFSDDELVAFIESRIEDDLQIIRINGSLVGGIAGMLLFLVTYFVEKVVG